MNITKCTIYWAHLPEHTDPMTEGYIGITKRNLDIRKKEHYQLVANGSQKLFHKKLRKHNNIIWTVIGFCFSVHTSLIIERAFRTNIKGTWNSQKGGNSFPNMNEDIRRKIGVANSGNKWDDKRKQNMSNKMKGRFIGELNPMFGKISPFKGRSHTEEVKKTLSKKSKIQCQGSNNPNAKLTEQQMKDIIIDFRNGYKIMEAAKKYNVSRPTAERYKAKSKQSQEI